MLHHNYYCPKQVRPNEGQEVNVCSGGDSQLVATPSPLETGHSTTQGYPGTGQDQALATQSQQNPSSGSHGAGLGDGGQQGEEMQEGRAPPPEQHWSEDAHMAGEM